MTAVNNIAEHYGMPIIYSTPSTQQKYIEKRRFQFHPGAEPEAVCFLDYNKLQMNSYCAFDSGTLSEEARCSALQAFDPHLDGNRECSIKALL